MTRAPRPCAGTTDHNTPFTASYDDRAGSLVCCRLARAGCLDRFTVPEPDGPVGHHAKHVQCHHEGSQA